MTEREAIEYFYNVMETGNIKNDMQQSAYEMAIEALEKQIPKKVSNRKVVYDFPASVHGDCPACGSINLSSADTNYCNVCGQKLDFSEIDVEKEIPPNTIDLTENEIKIHTANGWKNY